MKTGWSRGKIHIVLFCLLASAALLLLCSQCSPLYPINVWGDANCLLTVGRVMREGGVVYRDIYEQKGPALYLIQAAAASISDTGFTGVYVMETISFAAALYFAVRLMMRRMRAASSCALAAFLGACLLTGGAFSRGNSAEEFCLPLLMAALYIAFAQYGTKEGPMRAGQLFVCGILAGLVAAIKFTVLGLFIGLCAAEGLLALRAGGPVCAAKSALVFLGGMLLPIAAWCAYFALHGALGDFYTAYVHNNVFLYGGEARTFRDVFRSVYETLRDNALWVLAAAAGMTAFLLDRRERLQLRLAVFGMAVCSFAAVYLLGRTWSYSALALGVYAFAPAGSLAMRMDFRPAVRRMLGLCACVTALMLALASPNAYLRGVPRDQLAQTRLAAYIHPGATLLQYSHLDDGLYLTSGRLPQQKYFVRLNVQYDEMFDELDRYVLEAIPDYVLTSWEPLPQEFDRYQLIAVDAGYDDRDRINKPMYLYRRK